MTVSLHGQIAVVTGASSGLGLAIAQKLAQSGAAVAFNYHAHGEPAEQAAAEIVATGGLAQAIKADVSKEDEVVAMLDEVIHAWGALDIGG